VSFLVPFGVFGDWLQANYLQLIYTVVAIVATYVIYRLLARQIKHFQSAHNLPTYTGLTILRIAKWLTGGLLLATVLFIWNISFIVIAQALALYGGAVTGFAAINTIGNAFAGLIVMVSKPFKVGDRIFFNGEFADVTAVELIYTKMLTLDNVSVSVPNQEMLKGQIANYGKERVIRRHYTITPGFQVNFQQVEKALLEAANMKGFLEDPKPYVWMSTISNYSPEYTLYVFTDNVKQLPELDAAMWRRVFEICEKNGISLPTPTLIRSI
jgi:small conductance mechanosensitive channel